MGGGLHAGEGSIVFACLTLNRAELELYEQLYAHVKVTAPTPDLVVYLQAPVNVSLQRIYMRGRSYEQHLAPDCLERVCQSYAEFLAVIQTRRC
jgi:deoxyguanosine kinase